MITSRPVITLGANSPRSLPPHSHAVIAAAVQPFPMHPGPSLSLPLALLCSHEAISTSFATRHLRPSRIQRRPRYSPTGFQPLDGAYLEPRPRRTRSSSKAGSSAPGASLLLPRFFSSPACCWLSLPALRSFPLHPLPSLPTVQCCTPHLHDRRQRPTK